MTGAPAGSGPHYLRHQFLHRHAELARARIEIARDGAVGEIRVDISEAILSETMRVLRQKLAWDGYRIADANQKLRQIANVVTPTRTLDIIKEDPPDNRILECAVEAGSDYIVTWDKDLLRLHEHAGIRILTPVQFLARAR